MNLVFWKLKSVLVEILLWICKKVIFFFEMEIKKIKVKWGVKNVYDSFLSGMLF